MTSGQGRQPMHPMQSYFETGAATHPGKVRRQNEDCYLADPGVGLWAVADGMGGHQAGSLASSTVIGALKSIGSPVSAPDLLARLEDRVLRANTALKDLARERGIVIGSTIAALLVFDTHYAGVWSGDSRIYLIRAGRIVQISRDHTEVQELMDKGILTRDEARNWPRRHVVTNAIGVDDDPSMEFDHGMLQPGDAFVICSDGLTVHVEDGEILACVVKSAAQQACDALLRLTLERGATDNVTVIVVRYWPGSASAPVGAAAKQERQE